MLRKERLPHDVTRNRSQLLFLLLDGGDLDFLFTRDRLLRHRGVEQHIREQVQTQFHVGLGDIDRHAEAVIAGVA